MLGLIDLFLTLLTPTKETDVESLFQEIIAKMQELQLKLSDAEAFSKAQYDKGFADGVASVPVPPPVDTELEKKLEDALLKIAELEAKVSEMQALLDAVPAQIADAVKAENARVLEIVKAEELDLESKLALP
jgi:signal transduction protein with GAF and PtsI domain